MPQLDFSLLQWPATGPLLQACGIPLSMVVQPVGATSSSGRPMLSATGAASPPLLSSLARCKHCYAYINHLCELGDSSFACSVCGRSTELHSLTAWHQQYCRFPAARQHLPELQQQVYEVLVDPEGDADSHGHQHQQEGAGEAREPSVYPVTLALVDAAGPEDFLDLVRGGLGVALEALPPASLFGLIGVSDCITLVDLAGPGGPILHHLPVLESAPLLVGLEEVVPLSCLLVPVEHAKRCLAQGMALLTPDPVRRAGPGPSSSSNTLQQPAMDRRPDPAGGLPGLAAAGAGAAAGAAGHHQQQQQQQQAGVGGGGGLQPPCRALGPAIQAVMEYLRGLHSPHLAAPGAGEGLQEACAPGQLSGVAQLLLFLSGPPDIGLGKTVAMTSAGGAGPGGGGGGAGGGVGGGGAARGGAAAGAAGAAAGGAGRTISPSTGDLSRQMTDLQLHYPVQDPRSKAFYEQAAVAAASMGIVVDVFAAARGYVGLQTLEPLVNSTGGALYLYPSAEEATLPQDLYRRLATPKALCGMLRLRASTQVRVSRCYGRLYPDGQHKDLFHIPCCDPGQAFVFDFEHTGSGVYDARFQHVTLQVAFQYSQVVPLGAGQGVSGGSSSGNLLQQQQQQQPSGNGLAAAAAKAGSSGGGGGGGAFVVQRRLRVCSVRLPVAVAPQDVYSAVDADTVLTVLTHKITKAVRTQSVSEARLLLRDWLVIFTANYHRNSYMRASADQLAKLPVDLTFASSPLLAPLPRFVYALLRSPLLSAAAQYHSDLTAYLHHLWCGLGPAELSKAVYPGLTAFADPDTPIAANLPLSRHSLGGPVLAEAAATWAKRAVAAAKDSEGRGGDDEAAAAAAQAALGLSAAVAEGRQGADILLLDAFILVLVLYRAGGPASLPFPPPQDSRLWRTIADVKRERRVTTHVEVVRDGADGADLFYSLLIDDPDDMDTPGSAAAAAPGGQQQQQQGSRQAGPSPTGVDQFIQHIKAEVTMQLQH